MTRTPIDRQHARAPSAGPARLARTVVAADAARAVRRGLTRWTGALLFTCACLGWAAACGDDDAKPGQHGDDGGAEPSAGTGGKAGKGGGTAGEPSGGSGGGSGASAGTSSEPPPQPDDEDSGTPAPSADEDGGMLVETPHVLLTDMERAMVQTLSPLPDVPADPTNAHADDPAAAELGQMLFYDKSYSGPLAVASDLGAVGESGKIACFSCHSGPYLDDQRSSPSNVSLGADFHTRNAPTTINSAFYPWTNWGGRFSAQWELPLAVAESGVIMNSSRLRVAHVIFDTYRTEYEAVFGAMEPAIGSDATRFPATGKPGAASGNWEAMTDADRAIVNGIYVNFGKALEAYVRKLVSRNAAFDRFVAGDEHALDESAKRGMQIFLGKGRCFSCHNGPLLADGLFHNLGVPQSGDHVPASDDGRYKDIPPLLASPFNSAGAFSDDTTTGRLLGLTNPPPASARGQFRTPSLRGVALTAPYMHSGQLATLQDVVAFYDAGGGVPVSGSRDAQLVPLHLEAAERADLVAFLTTLTGDAVASDLLVDTSK